MSAFLGKPALENVASTPSLSKEPFLTKAFCLSQASYRKPMLRNKRESQTIYIDRFRKAFGNKFKRNDDGTTPRHFCLPPASRYKYQHIIA